MREKSSLSANCSGTAGYLLQKKKMKVHLHLTPYTKINSKQITDITLRVKTVKYLEAQIGVNRCDFGLGNDFL